MIHLTSMSIILAVIALQLLHTNAHRQLLCGDAPDAGLYSAPLLLLQLDLKNDLLEAFSSTGQRVIRAGVDAFLKKEEVPAAGPMRHLRFSRADVNDRPREVAEQFLADNGGLTDSVDRNGALVADLMQRMHEEMAAVCREEELDFDLNEGEPRGGSTGGGGVAGEMMGEYSSGTRRAAGRGAESAERGSIAAPPEKGRVLAPTRVPPHLWSAYTSEGSIPVVHWYFNESTEGNLTKSGPAQGIGCRVHTHSSAPLNNGPGRSQNAAYEANERYYTPDYYRAQLSKAHDRDVGGWGYGCTDGFLYTALDHFAIPAPNAVDGDMDDSRGGGGGTLRGKQVGVIGSARPWYEMISVAEKAEMTTVIEYHAISPPDGSVFVEATVEGQVVSVPLRDKLKYVTPREYNLQQQRVGQKNAGGGGGRKEHPGEKARAFGGEEQRDVQFDVILSISSLEHDGLGRCGDPVDPDADLRSMSKTRQMLSPEGLLFLAVPIGRDCVMWNAHRVYGRTRLQRLLEGWTVVGFFGDYGQGKYNPPCSPAASAEKQRSDPEALLWATVDAASAVRDCELRRVNGPSLDALMGYPGSFQPVIVLRVAQVPVTHSLRTPRPPRSLSGRPANVPLHEKATVKEEEIDSDGPSSWMGGSIDVPLPPREFTNTPQPPVIVTSDELYIRFYVPNGFPAQHAAQNVLLQACRQCQARVEANPGKGSNPALCKRSCNTSADVVARLVMNVAEHRLDATLRAQTGSGAFAANGTYLPAKEGHVIVHLQQPASRLRVLSRGSAWESVREACLASPHLEQCEHDDALPAAHTHMSEAAVRAREQCDHSVVGITIGHDLCSSASVQLLEPAHTTPNQARPRSLQHVRWFEIMREHRYVNILFLDMGYFAITLSWICNMENLDPSLNILRRSVFFTADVETYAALVAWRPALDLHVVLHEFAPSSGSVMEFGEMDYNRLMLYVITS